jgi:hypothetical protein
MLRDLGKAMHESWYRTDLIFIHYRLIAIIKYKNHRKVSSAVSLDGELFNVTFKTKLSAGKIKKNFEQGKPLKLKFGKFVTGDIFQDGEEYMLFDGGFENPALVAGNHAASKMFL